MHLPRRSETTVPPPVGESGNAASWFIDRHVPAGRGGKTAIECGTEHVSYAQLAERVNRFGSALRDQLGVRPEERIALVLPDVPEFAYAFFGALKIGAVPVPLNPRWTAAEYTFVLNDSRAAVLVTHPDTLPCLTAIQRQDVPWLRNILVVRGDGLEQPCVSTLMAAGAPSLTAMPVSADDVAFWLYSSGTTGAPKACVHLHHDMAACVNAFGRGVLEMTEDDRCLSMAKLYFAYGLGNSLYFPLGVGATTILCPDRPEANNAYRLIEAARPTLFFWVPSGYAMMLADEHVGRGDYDLSSIRLAVSAGEVLPAVLYHAFSRRFAVDVLDGVGSTEVLQTFISNRPGAIRPGSSGRIVPGYEARIVDEDGRPVGAGETGELLVKGDSTFAYYWNRQRLTADTIQGHWVRTGDSFSCDPDGFFWHAGRADDAFKVGGEWINPSEIEAVLLAHPLVRECAVVSDTDAAGLMKPAAVVVLNGGAEPSRQLEAALRKFVRVRLAPHKRPQIVRFVDRLPRTHTGKIQRYKLRGQTSGSTVAGAAAPA